MKIIYILAGFLCLLADVQFLGHPHKMNYELQKIASTVQNNQDVQ